METAENSPLDIERFTENYGAPQGDGREALLILKDAWPDLLARVRTAVASGKALELREAAHSMKGLLLQMFCGPASILAQRLEDFGLSGSVSSAPAVLKELEVQMEILAAEIDRLLGK